MKSREFQFYDKVWRVPYCCILGGSKQAAYERFCKLNGEDPVQTFENSAADASTFYSVERKTVLVWFAQKNPDLGTVAHEAVHAAIYALRMSGMSDFHDTNDEALAYYVQFLVEQFTGKGGQAR